MQRRWGATSCQRVFLERAEDILKQFSDDPNQDTNRDEKNPPDHATAKIVLGGMTFDLLLADENAKLNLNSVYRLRSADEVRRIVRESADSGGRLEVRLLPLRTKSTRNGPAGLRKLGTSVCHESHDSRSPCARATYGGHDADNLLG